MTGYGIGEGRRRHAVAEVLSALPPKADKEQTPRLCAFVLSRRAGAGPAVRRGGFAERAACCARRERPRRRAADERDELAPPQSITSSARASSVGGTSRPSTFAVLI